MVSDFYENEILKAATAIQQTLFADSVNLPQFLAESKYPFSHSKPIKIFGE